MTHLDFVVLGAQKSASTYLQDQIALHPEVDMASGEVRVFEDPFYAAGGPAVLDTLFKERPGLKRGIKRPDYLGRPEIPVRLQEYAPDVKLLVVLREPLARAVSSYFHMARHGFVPLRPVDEAFALLLSDVWADSYPRASEVLTYGLYGQHLSRYVETFATGQIMIFDQSEVTTNPQAALRRAFQFLEVDPGFSLPASGNRVSNRGIYSPFRLRLLRTRNKCKYVYSEDLARRDPRRMTPWGWAFNAGVVGVDRVLLSRLDPGRPPELTRRTRERLESYYSEDRETLKKLIVEWPTDVPWL